MEKLLKSDFPENVAIISFYDPPGSFRDADYQPVDYSTKTDCVFEVALHDIDFADIICQCEYGESRSSGCAAAIHEYFYKNGIDVFADYRYYPNQMVYHKVYDVLKKYGTRNGKAEE